MKQRNYVPGRLVFSLLLVLLMAGFAWASDEDINVMVESYGSSRDDAILHAKRDAVAQGIGTMLASETEIANFELKKDMVITKTIGAVKKYKVIAEEQQPGNVYYVKIKATVSKASIKADLMALKILLESMDRPRMMVMVQEESGQQAETAINDYLTSKEFELVDAATVAALMNKEDELVRKATQGDPVAAARLGAENGAEYVLVGNVKTSSVKNAILADSGMVSGQASLTVKVINCSTGRVIASKSATSAAPHISADVARDKAIAKASAKLMDKKLFEQIVSSFSDMVNNGITLNVLVKKVGNYQAQKAVRQALGGLEVVSVQKRSFGGGQLKLNVVFRGNGDAFCEASDGLAVKGKKLMVTDCTGNNVVMVMQ